MMNREIHLYIAEKDNSPLFRALTSGLPMYELCILRGTDPDGTVELTEGLKSIGFQRIRTFETDLDDYQRVFDSVCAVCSSYENAHFLANISSGNPIAIAAMTNAVQSFDSSLYYMKGDEAVVIQSDNLPEMAVLKSKRRILDTFLKFADSKSYTNRELMSGLSNSALTYHTRELTKMGLIGKEGSSKMPVWVITDKGEQMLRRLRSV